MRVLIVVSEAPPIVSGVSRCVDELTRGLGQRGADVTVISSNEIPRWTMGEVRLSSFAGYWGKLSRSFGAYDVINLHGPVPTMSDLFLALFRTQAPATRPALVYTHHSSVEIDGLRPLCSVYNRGTVRLASVADRVVVTTESYADMLRRPGGPPVDTVPWGVDAAAFTVKRPPRPAGPLRILFVGQMRPYKGIAQLLQAVAGQPELTLTVAGGGALADTYRQEAVRVGAANATFVGRVSDERLRELYGSHDVIALPSTTRAEAFGLVLLEGMAAGCVPVASDLPGVREVAGPTGVLVEPGNVTSLRQALLDLAADPVGLVRRGTASRGVAGALTWDRVADRYLETFRAAIQAVDLRQAEDLRAPFLQPEREVARLTEQFGADWGSLVLFDGRSRPLPRGRWGRVAADEFRGQPQYVAEYIARQGQPMVLNGDGAPRGLRGLLQRNDIASSMSVPVRMLRGTLGVLSLSVGIGGDRRYSSDDLDQFANLVGF